MKEAPGKKAGEPKQGNGAFPFRWYWLQFGIIFVSIIAALLFWQDIPSAFATHYNLRFEPDGYGEKSWGTVFLLNFVQLGLVALIGSASAAIGREKRERMSGKLAFANYLFLYTLSLLLTVYFSLIQATTLYGWPVKLLAAATIVLLLLIAGGTIGLIVLAKRLRGDGQGSGAGTGQDEESGHWLAGGGIYFNPDDPSLFVPKKYGIGWTLNFGKPMGWIVMATLIVIPIAIVLLVTMMV